MLMKLGSRLLRPLSRLRLLMLQILLLLKLLILLMLRRLLRLCGPRGRRQSLPAHLLKLLLELPDLLDPELLKLLELQLKLRLKRRLHRLLLKLKRL